MQNPLTKPKDEKRSTAKFRHASTLLYAYSASYLICTIALCVIFGASVPTVIMQCILLGSLIFSAISMLMFVVGVRKKQFEYTVVSAFPTLAFVVAIASMLPLPHTVQALLGVLSIALVPVAPIAFYLGLFASWRIITDRFPEMFPATKQLGCGAAHAGVAVVQKRSFAYRNQAALLLLMYGAAVALFPPFANTFTNVLPQIVLTLAAPIAIREAIRKQSLTIGLASALSAIASITFWVQIFVAEKMPSPNLDLFMAGIACPFGVAVMIAAGRRLWGYDTPEQAPPAIEPAPSTPRASPVETIKEIAFESGIDSSGAVLSARQGRLAE